MCCILQQGVDQDSQVADVDAAVAVAIGIAGVEVRVDTAQQVVDQGSNIVDVHRCVVVHVARHVGFGEDFYRTGVFAQPEHLAVGRGVLSLIQPDDVVALGIGSCWVNWIPYTKVREAFALPEEEELVLIMPIGYPAENSHPSKLHGTYRPLEELVRFL